MAAVNDFEIDKSIQSFAGQISMGGHKLCYLGTCILTVFHEIYISQNKIWVPKI